MWESHTRKVIALFALGTTLLGAPALAGGLNGGGAVFAQHFMQTGRGFFATQGDRVSYYGKNFDFWVEVPPATARLDIDVFDADPAGATWDYVTGGAARVDYRVYNPMGNLVLNTNDGLLCGACDNAWINLYSVLTPMHGHWRVEVDTSATAITDNFMHSYGLRAHDGNPGAGGTELNMYARNWFGSGESINQHQNLTVYPYVTSGCYASFSVWDGLGGTVTYTSRDGAWNYVAGIGTNSVGVLQPWLPFSTSNFTNQDAVGYGLFTMAANLPAPPETDGGGDNNWATLVTGDQDVVMTVDGHVNGFLGPAYRIRSYLERDGGGKPSKPYVEQRARFDSGVNPPVQSQGSVVAITLEVTNPTPHPIAFSLPNDVVTAYVPGGAVTYLFAGPTSQGSFTTQPASGGSGSVVWNPGTVAAGTSAWASYYVMAVPSHATNPVLLTGGGPRTTNGTFAQWVDETCAGATCAGTQLANATFTTHSLCGLTITPAVTTLALVREAQAVRVPEGVEITFSTDAEVGSRRFHLERLVGDGYEAVAQPLSALPGAAGGAHYQLLDPAGHVSDRYRIVEEDYSGKRTELGIVEAFTEGDRAERSPTLASGQPKAALRSPNRPAHGSSREAATTLPVRASEAAFVEVLVTEPGLQRLSSAALAVAFDADSEIINNVISAGQFSLTRNDQEVGWFEAPGGGLVFFAPDDLFPRPGTRRAYRLRYGFGNKASGVSPGPAAVPGRAQSLVVQRFEEDNIAATAAVRDSEQEFWFQQLLPTDEAVDVSLSLEAPRAQAAELKLFVHSVAAGDHTLEVRRSGGASEPAVLSWSGSGPATLAFPWQPESSELEVDFIFELTSRSESVLFLDAVEVRYMRGHRLFDSQLAIDNENDEPIAVLSDAPDLLVVATTNALAPRPLQTTLAMGSSGALEATLPAGIGATSLWVARPQHLAEPELEAVAATTVLEGPVDWLALVSDAELLDGALRLALLRESQGLTTDVVLAVDVLRNLGNGEFDIELLRNWLSARSPRYLVLVGQGSFDQRNASGQGWISLPAPLVATEHGLYSNDRLYASATLATTAATAVGRIPVDDAAELARVIDKIEAFEARGLAQRASYRPPALMLVDRDRDAEGFAAQAASTLMPFGPQAFNFLDLGETDFSSARSSFLAALEGGVDWVHFVGHSGVGMLSWQNLLTVEELALPDEALTAALAEHPFLLSAQSCLLARSELPFYRSLGEALLTEKGGGAVAVLGSTAPSWHVDGARYQRLVVQAWSDLDHTSLRVGDVLLESLERAESAGVIASVRETEVLLGDPATLLGPPPGEPAPAAPGDGGAGPGLHGGFPLFADDFEFGSTALWSSTGGASRGTR